MKIAIHEQTPEIHTLFEGFSVADLLEQRAIVLRKRRKRIRSKAALIAATARELEKGGFDALTIEGISEAAGMARGTFYLYYRNRGDIAAAVMKYYWALVRIHRPTGGARLPVRESIHRMNLFSANLAMKNARLLSGRETLMQENPVLARRLQSVNHAWANRIVEDIKTRGGTRPHDETPEFLHLKVRAVITMSDALLRDIYRNSDHNDTRAPVDLDLVVRVMDDLWLRALYANTPLVTVTPPDVR